jgi:hypothetical protein
VVCSFLSYFSYALFGLSWVNAREEEDTSHSLLEEISSTSQSRGYIHIFLFKKKYVLLVAVIYEVGSLNKDYPYITYVTL